MLNEIKNTIYTFIPIFVAIDIFAIIPIFISMTSDMPQQTTRIVERDSTVTALVVSLSFIVLGEAIFTILGITANDFKIAGGFILLIFAILDLMGYSRIREQVSGKMGVVPIGVPLIVGPAVLTTLIVVVDHYGLMPTIISLILNLLLVWLTLRAAPMLLKTVGKNGIAAISKVMALLLASIAIMMIRLGIENIIKLHIKP